MPLGSRPILRQQPYQLPHKQGIAFGPLVDCLNQAWWRGDPSYLHELIYLLDAQTCQLYPLEVLFADKVAQRFSEGIVPGDFHVPIGTNHQQATLCHLPGHELQQQQRCPAGPVEVVQNQHQGLRGSGVLQKGGDGIEEAEASLLRLQ